MNGQHLPRCRPPWLKVRMRMGDEFQWVDGLLKRLRVNTICREAACPNVSACFNEKTATFLLLGDVCTRGCRFCNVKKGCPSPPDPDEPERIARAVKEMGLRYVVVTSVTRDDLPDGGASLFSAVVRQIKGSKTGIRIEVLIPDLQGSKGALADILKSSPDVLGHNLETVPRLYPEARPGADYKRSLEVLAFAKREFKAPTKSGIMVGMGETGDEVLKTMDDLAGAGCDILTIGQYLAPTRRNLPAQRYYRPEEFQFFFQEGMQRGFRWIESGPLVRSSFHAQRQWEALGRTGCGS